MVTRSQLTGLRGVYLVAAELARLGLIAAPTSQNIEGVDLLVIDTDCKKTFSVQVKTKASLFDFWLLNQHSKEMVSPSHIYTLLNLREKPSNIDFFLVPSKTISERMSITRLRNSMRYTINLKDIKEYENNWDIFGNS
jgi:hypothetical protein